MAPPSIDLMDETFVVARRDDLAAYFARPDVCRTWWPQLRLTVTEDRGAQGVRWSVAGALTGTAEIWLEPWHDGVIVHWFLRAEPPPRTSARAIRRIRQRYAVSYKARIHRLKDQAEQGRAAGAAPSRTGR